MMETRNQDEPHTSVWEQVRQLYHESFARADPKAQAARRAQQQARQQAEVEARRWEAMAKRRDALAVSYQAAPHYCDQEFLQRHAKAYAQDLFERRDEIRNRYVAFYRDREFVAYLTDEAPHLLQFVGWEARALAEAEKFLVERGPLTPEEKAARIRRFRERAVERERTRIDDETAMAFVAFESIEELLDAREAKIQEIRARDDLDDSDKDERIRGIRAVTENRLETLLGGHRNDTTQASPESDPVILDE
jgi:hypothetical protein